MQRNFCLGSEWLYYKIYTGVRTADTVLLEKLYPVILDLKEKNLISKWFFIRYKDSDEHLRIRFLTQSPAKLSEIISALYPVFKQMLDENIVWKIQTDTYQREIERYGENTMTDSEVLFWQDSEMIVDYLTIKSSFEKHEMQLLFSFCAIDNFLNSFSVTNTNKLALMDMLQLSFKKEFDADKNLKKEINKQYQQLFQDINSFLTGTAQNEFSEIFKMIQDKQNQCRKTILLIKEKIQIPLSDFLTSHIHMMINRQYTSKQRMYELLIYDHLYRYYKTIEHKKTW
ncbi:hypothetical protein D3C72_349880 [compost metagenome]